MWGEVVAVEFELLEAEGKGDGGGEGEEVAILKRELRQL